MGEAVRMGRPIATMPHKELAAGRFAAALMNRLNCSELVASSRKDLVGIAVKLATDAEFQARMVQNVVAGATSIFEKNTTTQEWITFLDAVGRGHPAPEFVSYSERD